MNTTSRKRHPRHCVLRYNVYYALLKVPVDIQHILGRTKYSETLNTGDPVIASSRALILVAGWRVEIAKARKLPRDPKADRWDQLRESYLDTQNTKVAHIVKSSIDKNSFDIDIDMTTSHFEDFLEAQAGRDFKDPKEALHAYMVATGQTPVPPRPIPLTPLADMLPGWVASMKLAKKSVDQRVRDIERMTAHFVNLEALNAKAVKAWTDKLISEGVTSSSFERIGNGCRHFWAYLVDAGEVKGEGVQNPFLGPFKLAQKKATTNTIDRASFTPEEASQLHAAALANGDGPLADLIALGAYTGARIEELCSLTPDRCLAGRFTITNAKTKAGNREIPIHPQLVPLVARLVSAAGKGGYIVPSKGDNQYDNRSGALSQRFGHLKTAQKFSPRYVFHSFRHTLVTQLIRTNCNEVVRAGIIGHVTADKTAEMYGEGAAFQQKLDAISKVAFGGSLAAL